MTTMPEPYPPLTALQLLDAFDREAPSEIMAQLRVDMADHYERVRLDRCAVYRWKQSYRRPQA
jgi:hypothetical protein